MSPQRGGERGENVSTEKSFRRRQMCKVTLGVIPVSLSGLPMMLVLAVTHLFDCVGVEIIALFLSMHEGD